MSKVSVRLIVALCVAGSVLMSASVLVTRTSAIAADTSAAAGRLAKLVDAAGSPGVDSDVRLLTFRDHVPSDIDSMARAANVEVAGQISPVSAIVVGEDAAVATLKSSLADRDSGSFSNALARLVGRNEPFSEKVIPEAAMPDFVEHEPSDSNAFIDNGPKTRTRKGKAVKKVAEERPASETSATEETEPTEREIKTVRVRRLVDVVTTNEKFDTRQILPSAAVTVNFDQLVRVEKERRATQLAVKDEFVVAPNPAAGEPEANGSASGLVGMQQESIVAAPAPAVASPAPSRTFQAQPDQAQGGGPSGTFNIPPDTTGSVGYNKVFSQTNSNYTIHDKVTGAVLQLSSMQAFWTATGATGVFDPQIKFDPYSSRWLVAAASNAQTANSSILVGVSATPDPSGAWFLYKFTVGCASGGTNPITSAACNANGEYADFPMLGFGKNFVAVTWNQFTWTGTSIVGEGVFIDYPQMRTGPAGASLTVFTASGFDFCTHPATTLSATEPNLYMASHLSSGSATYRVWTVAGTAPSQGGGAPTITVSATQTRTGGAWTQPGGDVLPQTCVGVAGVTCPAAGTLRGIDSGDAQIRSNVVFRNGGLVYGQTVALPSGGLTTSSRFAAQWTVVNPVTAAFIQGGRVEDPTATRTGPGEHYAYPSVAVNGVGDVLLGYSNFSTTHFANAGYSYRAAADAISTMRDPVIYKTGEDYYSKTFGGTRNRWGDYSQSAVDPGNDNAMWTVQEYAGTRTVQDSSVTTNSSRWGTWWAAVGPVATTAADVYVEGRVLSSIGVGIRNARVMITMPDGSVKEAVTNSFGAFQVLGIPAGSTCVVNVRAKGYSFASQVVTVSDAVTGLEIVGY